MWSGPYWKLYCHAVCTWKLWNLPLSWFVQERIRPNLINPRVLKIERGLHVKMLDSAPFTWRNATCWRDYLLKGILRNHFLSENMQWNYASFNVTLNYLMHEIMEFCVTSSLARDNWEQKINVVKLLAISETIHTVCCEDDYFSKGKSKIFNSFSLSHDRVPCFSKKFVFYCWLVCRALSVGRM